MIIGMGLYLIIDILKEVMYLEDKIYILGVNEKIEVFWNWLSYNGFNIVDEYVIFDGFYYVFLKVVKGNMLLIEEDIYLGFKFKIKKEV